LKKSEIERAEQAFLAIAPKYGISAEDIAKFFANNSIIYQPFPIFNSNIVSDNLDFGFVSAYYEPNRIYQYLYLTSQREIKEGWIMISNTAEKVVKIEVGEWSGEKFVWHTDSRKGDANNCVPSSYTLCKKIEFTTDPKLIADGVPAVPDKCIIKTK